MSDDKPAHPWDDLQPPLHPTTGDPKWQGAWINIILEEEGDGAMGFTKPVTLFLHQYDLHNLIVLLWGAAREATDPTKVGDYDLKGTRDIYLRLARKLDRAWKLSLGKSIPDGSHRRR